MNYFILSPCGTSLLTNQASPDERNLIFKYANAKIEEDIPQEDLEHIKALIQRKEEELLTSDFKISSKLSAEINGLLRVCDYQLNQRQDMHYLLSTDTFLGETTSRIVEKWLQKNAPKSQTIVHRQKDLQTLDLDSFQLALSELIQELSKTIPGYRKQYKIIFNLTGGFKSVQGFLQSIAHFYADETVYIFEQSEQLLRIPSLPVKLDLVEAVQNDLHAFRRLTKGLYCNEKEVSSIADTLLFKSEQHIVLSSWGELVWEQTYREIYSQKVYNPPSRKIKYHSKFEKTVKDLPSERKILINQRMDQLAKYLESRHINSRDANPNSLDIKELKSNVAAPATHEIDAWSDLDAKRIIGYYEQSTFIIYDLITHLK